MVREKRTKFICTVKAVRKADIERMQAEERLKQEIELHAQLRHPHILRFYQYGYDRERIYYILEFPADQNLKSYVAERGGKPAEQLAAASSRNWRRLCSTCTAKRLRTVVPF